MNRRVIKSDCLPTRMPTSFILTLALALDRLDAPGWVWGIYITLSVLLVICVLLAWGRENEERLPGFGGKS